MLPEKTFVVAYNGGPGTLAYPGPRSGEVRDLVLKPWRYTPVPDYYLNDLRFRQDVRKGLLKLEQVADMPDDSHTRLSEKYDTLLSARVKQLVLALCSGDYKNDERGMNRFRDQINLPDHIRDDGRPIPNSNVTVKWLKEQHRYFLEAVLDLESRWQKRKPVLRDVRSALKKIEAL